MLSELQEYTTARYGDYLFVQKKPTETSNEGDEVAVYITFTSAAFYPPDGTGKFTFFNLFVTTRPRQPVYKKQAQRQVFQLKIQLKTRLRLKVIGQSFPGPNFKQKINAKMFQERRQDLLPFFLDRTCCRSKNLSRLKTSLRSCIQSYNNIFFFPVSNLSQENLSSNLSRFLAEKPVF